MENAINAVALVQGGAYHTADRGIHAGGIAAAGEYCKGFLLGFAHVISSFWLAYCKAGSGGAWEPPAAAGLHSPGPAPVSSSPSSTGLASVLYSSPAFSRRPVSAARTSRGVSLQKWKTAAEAFSHCSPSICGTRMSSLPPFGGRSAAGLPLPLFSRLCGGRGAGALWRSSMVKTRSSTILVSSSSRRETLPRKKSGSPGTSLALTWE